MTVFDPSRLFEMGKWLENLPEICREEQVLFSRRAINTFSHVTLETPVESSTVKIRPYSLIRSAFLLASAFQPRMVVR